MKKMNNKGFALVETLVVTIFIATVLIFLFIQLTNLSSSYEDSFNYNSVEGLYALDDIKEYILSDSDGYTNIKGVIEQFEYCGCKWDDSNDNYVSEECNVLIEGNYNRLLKLEGINEIIILENSDYFKDSISGYSNYSEGIKTFTSKINNSGDEPYRIVASFKNGTYATVRFGGSNE